LTTLSPWGAISEAHCAAPVRQSVAPHWCYFRRVRAGDASAADGFGERV
jgi:hypothetical protein